MSEEKTDLNKVAMEVILSAGDARACVDKALDAAAAFDFEEADRQLKEAEGKIVSAHNAQTSIIQAQVSGEEDFDYSLLFVHAQDTLMTINSELHLAKRLLVLTKAIDRRLG